MADNAQTASPAEAPLLPLFYKNPQRLHSEVHAGWRLKSGDASFAAGTPFVPIVASELAAAARSYPVVFAADSAQPIAVLGLEQGCNLFVADGKWAADAHVPAYVRRYPFAFTVTEQPAGFALVIDKGSDRVAEGGAEGEPLFVDGEPSAFTKEALEFCAAFGRDADLTRLFASALHEKDLLIDRRADATLPDDRTLGLDGFQIVDAAKFAALDDETVLAWHKQGLLALVNFHLASLERFRSLLDRQALRSVTGPSSSAASKDVAGESSSLPSPAEAPAPVDTPQAADAPEPAAKAKKA
ncbi:SapC protein [Sphingomonas laterariae]|uniref:SapC protein n=1 Tax=Edaphosphingomonas laterariae TaxID=861865 RepID=A0A239KQV3_9SPHN|nr:SapC family protein [Sphingomonas laterariae]SNT19929.1 SapC protein [Sphingomonas laterariae]